MSLRLFPYISPTYFVAQSAIRSLEGAGIFGVELFEMEDGTVLLNEIAPRPHNSGHYTMDGCYTEQHEQVKSSLDTHPTPQPAEATRVPFLPLFLPPPRLSLSPRFRILHTLLCVSRHLSVIFPPFSCHCFSFFFAGLPAFVSAFFSDVTLG